MHSSKIHVVYKKEVHLLYECGCNDCACERKRREEESSDRPHLSIPPSTAYLFGLIPSRQSQGSLARQLMSNSEEN